MTGHEELLALWALAEKQKQELAWKDQTIEAQKAQIEKQRIQIENLIQELLHARKKLFGPSAEVSKYVDGQLSLFDTAQKLAKEQKRITVPAHTCKARQPGVRAEILSGLVQVIEEYIIPETGTHSKCGSELKIIGKRIVRMEVEFIPAKKMAGFFRPESCVSAIKATGKTGWPWSARIWSFRKKKSSAFMENAGT